MKSIPFPILNLGDLSGGALTRQQFLSHLAEAGRTGGFFYLTGHGLCCQKQALLKQVKAFFALPEQDKTAVEMTRSRHFRGYTRFKGELTQGRPDQREQFDFMNESPARLVQASDPQWLNLIGPNQWPAQLPELKTASLAYQDAQAEITKTLLAAFAEALGQPKDIFFKAEETPYMHSKHIRYPGVNRNTDASDQGVGAHKDPGYLTLVSQDTESGLEVELEGQGWLSVPPIEGTLVVNVGELLELASDGYLRAANHRVVSPKHGVDRYSLAFFMAAPLEARVPLLDLPPELKVQALGPTSDPNNPLFFEVGENIMKGRVRSHPDVAQAWQLSA